MGEALERIPDEETAVAAPASDGAAILQVIERAALNPNVDIDKMERLLQMHERIMARNAETAFNAAMQAAQAEMPQVTRDAVNDQTKSRYARLETISKAMNPVITKHGFSTSFGTDTSPIQNHYRITCDVSHSAGHTRHYHADVPADGTGMKGTANKTATHAFGSTMSYGRRYLKTLIFDVSTTDDDDGQTADGREMITDEQVMDLQALIEDVGADKAKFLRFLKVDSLSAIAAERYEDAVACLEEKRRRS